MESPHVFFRWLIANSHVHKSYPIPFFKNENNKSKLNEVPQVKEPNKTFIFVGGGIRSSSVCGMMIHFYIEEKHLG
ncbi:hypothetical protein AB990_21225 [Alkalihalobacillus pseudalcaliphilus]|nr:hypothetical protein AB990_21225 [Alkalihalobacillus pseudalcaliphilus]